GEEYVPHSYYHISSETASLWLPASVLRPFSSFGVRRQGCMEDSYENDPVLPPTVIPAKAGIQSSFSATSGVTLKTIPPFS
ncbi:MAG: hypothetical protein OXI33_08505, partial [Chloroflexota bacterium]|nr:hypothetical protein [Chloroflexota bacterium]